MVEVVFVGLGLVLFWYHAQCLAGNKLSEMS